jgi:hypothetical protein
MKAIFPIPNGINCLTVNLTGGQRRVTPGLTLDSGGKHLVGLPGFSLLASNPPAVSDGAMTYAHTRSSVAGPLPWEASAVYQAMNAPWGECAAAIIRVYGGGSHVTTLRIWDSPQLIESAEHIGSIGVGRNKIFCLSLADGRKFLTLDAAGALSREIDPDVAELARQASRRTGQVDRTTRARLEAEGGSALLQQFDEVLLGLVSDP